MPHDAPVLRRSALIALTIATALLCIVSVRANFLYGLRLGQSAETKLLLACASAAFDIWKAFGLVAVIVLARTHRALAALAFSTWGLCTLMAMSSAIAVYASDRALLVDQDTHAHTRLTEIKNERREIEARLTRRAAGRTVREIDALIATQFAQPFGLHTLAHITDRCTRVDRRSAPACARIAKLQEEREHALETERLQSEAAALRANEAALRARGAAAPADPIAHTWSRVARGAFTPEQFAIAFPLLFALILEAVSAFGPSIILALAAAGRALPEAAAARIVPQQPSAAGSVMQWFEEATEPSRGAPVAARDLYAHYVSWCITRDQAPAVHEHFIAALDAIVADETVRGKLHKHGAAYVGVRAVGEGSDA